MLRFTLMLNAQSLLVFMDTGNSMLTYNYVSSLVSVRSGDIDYRHENLWVPCKVHVIKLGISLWVQMFTTRACKARHGSEDNARLALPLSV